MLKKDNFLKYTVVMAKSQTGKVTKPLFQFLFCSILLVSDIPTLKLRITILLTDRAVPSFRRDPLHLYKLCLFNINQILDFKVHFAISC